MKVKITKPRHVVNYGFLQQGREVDMPAPLGDLAIAQNWAVSIPKESQDLTHTGSSNNSNSGNFESL